MLEQADYQARSAVRVANTVTPGLPLLPAQNKQHPVSPTVFVIYLEWIIETVQQIEASGVSIQGQCINNLRFADDVDLLDVGGHQ